MEKLTVYLKNGVSSVGSSKPTNRGEMRKAIIITVGLMALLLPGVASAQDSTVEFAITVPEGFQVIEDVPGYR